MKKLKKKFMSPSDYRGTVGTMTIYAKGRTKREAVKRLRHSFAQAGHPTQPSALDDKLVVEFLGKRREP